MAQQTINVGAAPNDGSGDPLRTSFQKTNANFSELYSVTATQSGDLSTINNQILALQNSTAEHSNNTVVHTHAIAMSIDNGSNPIETGVAGYFVCPFSGTIVAMYMVADAAGSAVIDIWKASNAIPIVANSICSSEKPTLAAAQYTNNTGLTGWTKTVAAGDVFAFNVDSASGINQLTITLRIV